MFTTKLTVILDRHGLRKEFEMPSATSVGYAAMRVAESLGLDPEVAPCALGNPRTGTILPMGLSVSAITEPVQFLVEMKPRG